MLRSLDTGTEDVLCHVEDGVASITLNRPDRRNALSSEMNAGLRTILPRLAEDDDVGCLLLTGAGRAFCAGGDVKAMNTAGAERYGQDHQEQVRNLAQRQSDFTGALHAHPRPVIAALAGPAAGAGLAIALACDLRIAAESAFITTGYANVALSGDYGISWFLTRLVGHARACELLFTARRVDAHECERLGIINRVVPDDQLETESMDLARQIASGPRTAIRCMKENLNYAATAALGPSMDGEAERLIGLLDSDDHREAVRAFVEKRPPRFEH